MTKAMSHRYADAFNEEESYERATAFLSSWIEDSLVVPPTKGAKHPQRHLPLSIPLSDLPLPLPSVTLKRRSTISNDDNINSLVNSLQASILLQHEHQNQNRSSDHGSRVLRNVSPTCVGAVLRKELPSRRRGRGALPSSSLRRSSIRGEDRRRRSCGDAPSKSQSEDAVRNDMHASIEHRRDEHSSMKNSDEKTRLLPSNRSSKTKSSRKKSRRHTVASECNPSTSATNKPSSSEASLSLDRLRELDGPNFDLGDTFRSPKHQIIEPNPTKALHLANQLRTYDFAWVLRSSHEWTYGIVADFPNQGGEKSILFVIDKLGNTKTLKMKHWAKCIRLVDAKSKSH